MTPQSVKAIRIFKVMKIQWSWAAAIVFLSLFAACKPDPILDDGPLEFSSDTVRFDSIFTGYDSPTERLMFINPGSKTIKIDAIYIEGGDASEFEMIVDGLDTNLVEDYELDGGDSAIIFIKMVSNNLDDFARDRIIFEIGNQTQDVELEAFIMDAHFITAPGDSAYVFDCNAVLSPGKPYVLDGICRVAPGCTLRIEAGTELHFTPRKDANFNLISMIEVHGTIEVEGSLGNEVIMKQSRFGPVYEENPGQWRGIRLWTSSRGNYIRHAVIKNALIGVEVDSISVNNQPKLLIEKSEIRNMAGYGLLGIGASPFTPSTPMTIEANNCLVHNCAFNTVLIFAGGNFEFNNCTFVNYTLDFSRSDPQIGITNYFEDTAGVAFPFDVEASFNNCIIWGSEEEEVGYDTLTLSQYPVNATYDNCIVRSTFDIVGNGLIKNQDPKFLDPKAQDPDFRDYRIGADSPAIDQGKDLSSLFFDDLNGVLRSKPFDIGAFEYFPE